MKDILNQLEAWQSAGRRVALATVVRMEKSAPRPPGAAMAVNDQGEVAGSVSGGCVEAALYEEATAVLQAGAPRLVTYGFSNEQAFEVGLTCGGIIHLFVEPMDWAGTLLPALAAAIRRQEPVALITVIGGPGAGSKLLVGSQVLGGTGVAALDEALVAEARAMLEQGQTGIRHFGPRGERRQDAVMAFVESFAPPPRLIVFGAIDFAAATVRMGKFLGFHVTLCDARPVFATRARFPEADALVVAWPHEYLQATQVGPRDAICVLTHDPKFDIPALLAALQTPAFYIGAMGSRSTHERREQELLAAGGTPAQLERIRSPIGLDLGGRTPDETAVAIAAELIALRHGHAGGHLRDRSGRIHGAASSPAAGR